MEQHASICPTQKVLAANGADEFSLVRETNWGTGFRESSLASWVVTCAATVAGIGGRYGCCLVDVIGTQYFLT